MHANDIITAPAHTVRADAPLDDAVALLEQKPITAGTSRRRAGRTCRVDQRTRRAPAADGRAGRRRSPDRTSTGFAVAQMILQTSGTPF